MTCIFISQFYLMPLFFKMMEERKGKCGSYFRIFYPLVTCKGKYKNHYMCWKIRLVFHLCNPIPYFNVSCCLIMCRKVSCIFHYGFKIYMVLGCNAVCQGACVCLFVMNIIKVYIYWHFLYDIICIFYELCLCILPVVDISTIMC